MADKAPDPILRENYEMFEAAIRSDQMSHRDVHAMLDADEQFRVWLTARAMARIAQANGGGSEAK